MTDRDKLNIALKAMDKAEDAIQTLGAALNALKSVPVSNSIYSIVEDSMVKAVNEIGAYKALKNVIKDET